MQYGLIIFSLAFLIRTINLLLQDLNIDSYILEDQKIYWEWSLKHAYLEHSSVPKDLLSERMPGAFLYFEFLQWLTNKNLFKVLLIQSVLDSITCVIISNCAYLINKNLKLYVGLFAAFSPLMIIVSSQVLSDTLFLFTFVGSLYFLLKFYSTKGENYYIFFAAIMLGFSTYVRAATFPFVFLSLPIVYFLVRSYKNNFYQSFIVTSLFLVLALAPVNQRLLENLEEGRGFLLTSQTGSHMAYWMVPGVLTIKSDYDRSKSVEYVNSEIEKLGGFTGDPFEDSNKLSKISLNILSKQSPVNIAYAWLRASLINTIVSPILIDNRVRKLTHPSFADEGNIIVWFEKLISHKDNMKYAIIIIVSSILTAISAILFFGGFIILYKNSKVFCFLALPIIIYFCLITGPTFSPKYCIPFVPIVFFLQALFLNKLFIFYENWVNSKKNN